jgi:hypothetical protein
VDVERRSSRKTLTRASITECPLIGTSLGSIAVEGTEMTAFEDFVGEQVLGSRSFIGPYPATHAQTLVDLDAWRKANGR